jgi:hypothetical protein
MLFCGVTVLHKTDTEAPSLSHLSGALMPWDGFSERILPSFLWKFISKALGRESPAGAI